MLLYLLFLFQACFTCAMLALSFITTYLLFIQFVWKPVRVLLKEKFFFCPLGYRVDSDSVVIEGL